MKIFIFGYLVFLASCAPHTSMPPSLSSLGSAPQSIRESVELYSGTTPPAISYRFRLIKPPSEHGWIDLKPLYDNDSVFLSGDFAYGDDDPFSLIERIKIDTGYNGYLNFPLGHPKTKNLWLSVEFGETSSLTLTGQKRSWVGVGSGLGIEGILVFPIPVVVSEISNANLAKYPTLGQAWFEFTKATWIDPSNEALSVSFEPSIAKKIVAEHPDMWMDVPWRMTKPNGHRFVPIKIGGQVFEAVIDTGSELALFLDTPHPPDFVSKPWNRSALITGARSGTVMSAMSRSSISLSLGDIELEKMELSWSTCQTWSQARPPPNHPLAILGIPFLRRYPVLLDPANDLAYFFIGDQTDLSSINRSIGD